MDRYLELLHCSFYCLFPVNVHMKCPHHKLYFLNSTRFPKISIFMPYELIFHEFLFTNVNPTASASVNDCFLKNITIHLYYTCTKEKLPWLLNFNSTAMKIKIYLFNSESSNYNSIVEWTLVLFKKPLAG